MSNEALHCLPNLAADASTLAVFSRFGVTPVLGKRRPVRATDRTSFINSTAATQDDMRARNTTYRRATV